MAKQWIFLFFFFLHVMDVRILCSLGVLQIVLNKNKYFFPCNVS